MRSIVFGISVLLGMTISLPIMLILKIFKKEDYFYKMFLHPFFKILLKILYVKINIQGKIDYPLNNTLIISNHLSLIDIVLLMSVIDKRVVFVSKIENKKVPIIGWWILMNKTILIDRNNLRQSIRIMKEVTTNLKNNIPVVIFPQGTRNKNMEFKAGSLKYVHKSQGDILPLGIKGTDNVLKGFFSYQKKTVELFINPLIKYEDFKEKNLVQVNKNIEKLIKEQVSG